MAARLAIPWVFFSRVPFQGDGGVCPVVPRKPGSLEIPFRTGFQRRPPRSSNRAGVQGGTATLSRSGFGEFTTLDITESRCECGNILDVFGRHRAGCPHSDRSRMRAGGPERTLARVCRKAGVTARCNTKLRDMNVAVAATDQRATEVLPRCATCCRHHLAVRSQCGWDGNARSSTHRWRCPPESSGRQGTKVCGVGPQLLSLFVSWQEVGR